MKQLTEKRISEVRGDILDELFSRMAAQKSLSKQTVNKNSDYSFAFSPKIVTSVEIEKNTIDDHKKIEKKKQVFNTSPLSENEEDVEGDDECSSNDFGEANKPADASSDDFNYEGEDENEYNDELEDEEYNEFKYNENFENEYDDVDFEPVRITQKITTDLNDSENMRSNSAKVTVKAENFSSNYFYQAEKNLICDPKALPEPDYEIEDEIPMEKTVTSRTVINLCYPKHDKNETKRRSLIYVVNKDDNLTNDHRRLNCLAEQDNNITSESKFNNDTTSKVFNCTKSNYLEDLTTCTSF